MKRIGIVLLVVAMGLVMASPAGAVKPDCATDPTHPSCQTDEEPPEDPPLEACPSGTFTVSGIGQTWFECLWRPAFEEGVDVATVTISNLDGGVRRPPTLFVRDDAPGDICLYEFKWETQTEPYEESFELFYDEVPVPDLPDVLDYGAWLGRSYWNFVWQEGMEPGTDWCAPQDTVLGSIREDNNGGALTLTAKFDAKKGGSFDIALFPENSN